MNAWFLVILFASTNDAKIAVFKSESDCKLYLPVIVQQNEKNPDVKSIECIFGTLKKEGIDTTL